LPCYQFNIITAPYFKRYGKRPGIIAFVDGVTAAAIGAISGAVVVLGRRMIFENGTIDLFKLVLALAALALFATGRKIPEPLVVLASALVGLAAYSMFN
jgi:chromate transporter